jgi:cytochrome c2
MIRACILGTCLIGLATLAHAGMKETYLPSDPLKGTVHFSDKGCDRCHSIDGQGGNFGPDLARSEIDGSLLDLVAMMWNHSPEMSRIMDDLAVGRPRMTSAELSEIAAYVYYIAYFDSPGDIATGARVFTDKGCNNCHRVGGIGRKVGPDLSPIKKYVSPIFLMQMMWNHGSQIRAKMSELGVSWPEFNGDEVADLMAFLRDASAVTDPERIFMRPGNPKIGEQLFREKRCISCHRVFDAGRAVGPDLRKSTFHKSASSIAAVMWNHGPAIWDKMDELGLAKPKFESNEMADLTAFLYFLRFLESPSDAARGELLFRQKGCQNCHHFGEAQVMGSYGLSFSDGEDAALDVAAAMWNTADEMSDMMTRKRLEWPRFQAGELNDLIHYILDSSHR